MRRLMWMVAVGLAACKREPPLPDGVVINEVLSANRAAWADPDSGECPEYDDFVELYNASDEVVSLDGMRLSDDAGPGWALPAVELGVGEHVVILADDDVEQGPLHAPFKVSRDGETLTLLGIDGVALDQLVVPALDDDHAWGRYGDGGLVWREQAAPSPGAANEAPPADDCFAPPEGFDDRTVPCISTREGYAALASRRAGLEVVKFDILGFQSPQDRHVVFLDSRFYTLHDEWYIFRMLNGQRVEGETVFSPYDGNFPSMAAITEWAAAINLVSLFDPAFLRWVDNGRLYSQRYYDLALGEVRIIGVGTLVHALATDERAERWAFELEASDDATHADIVAYFETLEAQLPAEIGAELRWLVRSTGQEALAAQMEASGLAYSDRLLRYDDLAATGEVTVYRPGTVAGRVRHIRAGQGLEDATAEDILILDEIPDYLPPCAALITSVPQTPLAHIALLAENRRIPNLYVAGIADDPMWDAWARVRAPVALAVSDGGLEVVAITSQEFATWKALVTHVPPDIAAADVTDAPYTMDLTQIPIADMPRWRPILGGKSTGMIALAATPGVALVDLPLGITIRAYREHLETFPWVAEVLGAPAFARPGDARVRYLVLEGREAYDLRYTSTADASARDQFLAEHAIDHLGGLAREEGVRGAILAAPIATSLRAQLVPVLATRFAAWAPAQALRFRSSSNIEDADGFTGAGLYASFSGYLEPAAGEPSVDDAIRAVWASYWGAEAFEERHAAGIDHRAGDMGITVHAKFGDELELANGVVTITRLPDDHADRWEMVFNSHPGAISVTNPPPDTCLPVEPEVVEVTQTQTGSPVITRVRRSTELPAADVLSDAELLALFDQATDVLIGWLAVDNGRLPAEQQRATLILDLEWRKVGDGWPIRDDGEGQGERIVWKQSRPFGPSPAHLPADVLAEPFPRDLLARVRTVTRTTCATAEATLLAVQATTDPELAPDMGYTDAPFTASIALTATVDLPELDLLAGESVSLSHLDLDVTAGDAPWQLSADVGPDAVGRTGIVAVTADGTTLSVDALGGEWAGTHGGCVTTTAWASAETYLADLF